MSTAPRSNRPLTLLVAAGEASGDAHGAELINALKQAHPGVRIIGVGGHRMAAAGQDQLFDLAEHAVLGLFEVLRHWGKFVRLFNQVLDLARREQPDAVVLIDNPGFNLRLADKFRRILPKTPIIYYISPQVWAWKAGRVRKMKKDIDLLLVIFPFEKTWFARKAPEFNVQWVGHPLLDRMQKLEKGEPELDRIALLPGSRRAEITRNLPRLWEAAQIMSQRQPGLKFMLLSPTPEVQQFSLGIIEKLSPPHFAFQATTGYAMSHLSRCGLALVASGTASLECALVGVPQIVVYRVNGLTYAIGRYVVKVKYLSIINVMAQEKVVPELIQENFQPARVAETALELLHDHEMREKLQRRVAKVVASLGGPGASERAAQAVLLAATGGKLASVRTT